MKNFSKIHLKYPTILASSSPQRQILLKNILQTDFKIIPHQINEKNFTSTDPFKIASILSKEKALDVFERYKDHLVIAADTLVILKDKVYGKPVDSHEAFEMLKDLSNQTHDVTTSVTLRWPKGFISFTENTELQFRILTDEEIKKYIDTQEWTEKAGAYAIQGTAKLWVKYLKGEVDNVIGLPTKALREAFQEIH